MRLRLAAVSLAATAFLAVAPAAASAKTAAKITIQTEADGFSGYVKSSARSCHSGRKVTLYRKVAGPDKKAGSDTAQPNQDGSQWKISVSRDGSYYAVVSATRGCKAAKSAVKRAKLVPTDDEGEGATAAQGDGDDGPAIVRITLKQGFGDYRKGVLGRVFSTNPDCVADQTVTFYRRKLASDGNSVIETKAGTSTVKQLPGIKLKRYNLKFGLVRSGSIVAKTSATDDCQAARSRPVSYNRPF